MKFSYSHWSLTWMKRSHYILTHEIYESSAYKMYKNKKSLRNIFDFRNRAREKQIERKRERKKEKKPLNLFYFLFIFFCENSWKTRLDKEARSQAFVPVIEWRLERLDCNAEAQWPIGYGVGLWIKRSSVRIRPWPLRWVLGQGSLLPLSQGDAFTLASISYLAILVKYILAKKKSHPRFRGAVHRDLVTTLQMRWL